jgi:hypothetical protein
MLPLYNLQHQMLDQCNSTKNSMAGVTLTLVFLRIEGAIVSNNYRLHVTYYTLDKN